MRPRRATARGPSVRSCRTIADRRSGDAVSAPTHCGNELVLVGKVDCGHNIHRVRAKCNDRGSTIDASIPDSAGCVVTTVVRAYEPSVQSVTESSKRTRAKRPRHLRLSHQRCVASRRRALATQIGGRWIVRRASAPPFCRIENDFFKQKGGLWSAHCAVPATKACSISLKNDSVCARQMEEVRALQEGPTPS